MGERWGRALPFILLFVVSVFILYPVIKLVLISFDQEGTFSLAGYVDVFTSKSTLKALWNTLKMETGILLGGWTIGGMLAFLRYKTDFKDKNWLDTLVFLSFTIPAYILAVSWVQIAAQNGYLHRIVAGFFPEVKYRVNAYTIGASAIILALHVYPLVYYGVGNALKLLGNSFEDAARIAGARRLRIIFRVILPLVLPSFISTGLLVVSRTMANFGVPAQLAMPRGNEVLTVRIYSAMADLNLPVIAVLSLLLVLFSVALFLLSEWALRNRVFDAEGQLQAAELSVIRLGNWQTPIRIMIILFFSVSILIPFLSIIVSSFFKHWGLALEWKNLTLDNYVDLFSREKILTQPLLNSLGFGLLAASAASLIASLVVYFYQFQKTVTSRWLLNIAQLPIAIPNIILAVAAMFAWINEPFKLYGTKWIIIVTYAVLFIPICIKQMVGAAKNLDGSMDRAAQTMGIPIGKRFAHIFLPQIKSSLLSGFLICFLISLKEIPISLLLYSAGTKTLGVMLFTIQTNAYGLEMTSTVAMVVIGFSIIGNLILNKLGSRGYKA